MCEIELVVRKCEKRQPIENGCRVAFESLEYDVTAKTVLKSDKKINGDIIVSYARNLFCKVQDAIDAQKEYDGLSVRSHLLSEAIDIRVNNESVLC